MMTIDPPTMFVRLALQIDRHFPGYVDGYFGPPELCSAAESEDLLPPDDLGTLAASLEESIRADSSLPADRRDFLLSEVHAMRMTLRILSGDAPEIVDEVQRLYGVKPEWVDENVFHEAHKAVNDILTGGGPLPQRVADFRERSRIPVDAAMPIIQEIAGDLRRRTRSLFALPPQEECAYSMVNDRVWTAYNWYLGQARSRIEFNTDLPMWVTNLPMLIAHETYPGHHTEHAIKEERLYRQGKRLENAILLNNAPSALVSEGIAMNALEIVATREEITDMFVRCYRNAGLDPADGKIASELDNVMRPLDKVSDNQTLLLHRDHAPDEEIIKYGLRHALTDEKVERKGLSFMKDPICRSYSFNYTLGRDLVSAYLDASSDRIAAFARLLSEPITPGQIAIKGNAQS